MPDNKVSLGFIGGKGVNLDMPDHSLPLEYAADMYNMRSYDGSLQGVYAFADTDDALIAAGVSDNVYAIAQWHELGTDKHNLAFVSGEDDTALETTVLKGVSSNTYASTTLVHQDLAWNDSKYNIDIFDFNGLLIVNDGTRKPYYAQFGDNDTDITVGDPLPFWFPDSDGAAVIVKKIVPFGKRLVALNISNQYAGTKFGSLSFAWTDFITDIEDLNSATWRFSATNNAGDDFATATAGEFLDALQLGEVLLMYKQDGVYRAGDDGSELFHELLPYSDGLFASGCAANVGDGRQFFVGNYGIYLCDGGPNFQDVSEHLVKDYFFEHYSKSHRNRTFVFHHQRDKEMWVCYTRYDDTDSPGCNEALCFNYVHNSWYRRSLPNVRALASSEHNGEYFIWAATDGGIRRLGDADLTPQQLEPGGYSEWRYQDLTQPQLTKQLTAIYPMCSGRHDVCIDVTNKLGTTVQYDSDNPAYCREFDPAEDYKLDKRLTGRYYSLKLKVVETGNNTNRYVNPKISRVDVAVKPRGHRG